MKKLLLVVAVALLGFNAQAQDGKFSIGVNAGMPSGNAGDVSSFVIGAEANYLFEVSDQFLVGPSVGYINFMGKTILGQDLPSFSFLPIAAAGRFNASDDFTLGLDLGYSLGLSPEGNDGGFYWRPMVGYNISDGVMIQAHYGGTSVSVADGLASISWSSFGAGVMFSL